MPERARPSGRFIAKAKWEGVVLEVRPGEFDARLVDMLGTEGDVTATFPVDDLSAGDARLLRTGAVFYFNIGYFENAAGQRSRVAEVKFRRLPARGRSDLERAKSEAAAIRRELGLE